MPDGMSVVEAFFLSGQLWWRYPGSGFALWSPEHLAALALCVVLIAALVARADRPGLVRAVAVVPLCSLALTNALTAAQGAYDPTRLPLYLCNLCELIVLVDCLHPNALCDECSFALAMLGGVSAILFPGWPQCPIWSLPSVTGFLEHSCLVAYPLMRMRTGALVPRRRRAWMPMAVGGAHMLAVIPYNLRYGSNFDFVPDPMGTEPLASAFRSLGNPGYTLLVFTMGCAIVWVEYLLCARTHR